MLIFENQNFEGADFRRHLLRNLAVPLALVGGPIGVWIISVMPDEIARELSQALRAWPVGSLPTIEFGIKFVATADFMLRLWIYVWWVRLWAFSALALSIAIIWLVPAPGRWVFRVSRTRWSLSVIAIVSLFLLPTVYFAFFDGAVFTDTCSGRRCFLFPPTPVGVSFLAAFVSIPAILLLVLVRALPDLWPRRAPDA